MIRACREGLLVVAMVGAASCSQLPKTERPESPVASTYPAYGAPGAGARAVDIPWRSFFADARLQALIGQALESNRDLQVAVLRIEEARAEYRIVRAERLPTVTGGASARFSEGRGGGGGATTGGSDNGGGGGSTGSGGGSGEFYSVDVGVSAFELDFWGRVRSLSAAALARYLETEEARAAFQLSLINDLASAYLLDRSLAERAAIAEETIVSRRESLRVAELRYRAGEGSNLEVQQELVLLTQAQADLAALRLEAERNLNFIDVLTGRPRDPTLPPPRLLSQQGLVESITAGLPSELLNNRPDIRAAEQRLAAAGAEVGAARAALFPVISLTGALGFASPQLGSLFSRDSFNASVAPSLTYPFFDGGRRRAEIAGVDVRRRIAVAEYERAVQTAFQEVANALAGRRFLADQLAAQTEARAAQAERARLAQLRFEGGVADRLELLDARRELFAVDQALVETREAQLVNAVALYIALGGGDDPATGLASIAAQSNEASRDLR